MRRLLACLLFLAGPATAAPAYVYDFFITQIDCPLPDSWTDRQTACEDAARTTRWYMEPLSLTLSYEAARAGHASLSLYNGPTTEIENDGFLALRGPFGTLDLINETRWSSLLNLSLDLTDIGITLGGTIALYTAQESIVMGGGGAWTGLFGADAIIWSGQYLMPFNGEWRLVQVIPEPGEIAVLLVLLIALHKRQKTRPARPKPSGAG